MPVLALNSLAHKKGILDTRFPARQPTGTGRGADRAPRSQPAPLRSRLDLLSCFRRQKLRSADPTTAHSASPGSFSSLWQLRRRNGELRRG